MLYNTSVSLGYTFIVFIKVINLANKKNKNYFPCITSSTIFQATPKQMSFLVFARFAQHDAHCEWQELEHKRTLKILEMTEENDFLLNFKWFVSCTFHKLLSNI